ncbi:MAG: hypothetical protein IJ737_03730 [Ruminococcus sp.]|nr:hypothetical protein [Ruminococcus sp.]
MDKFKVLKTAFTVIGIGGTLLFIVMAVLLVGGMAAGKAKKDKAAAARNKKRAGIAVAGMIAAAVGAFGTLAVAVKQYSFDFDSLPTFKVSSEDIHGGVWDDAVTNTEYGTNTSPQLSFESYPGAGCYAVVMIDESADNWCHWYINGVTGTTLERGWSQEEGRYVGPYPPSGTHTYTVYVFALKYESNAVDLNFDGSGNSIEKIASMLDNCEQTDSNNVLAYGKLSGTYTAK